MTFGLLKILQIIIAVSAEFAHATLTSTTAVNRTVGVGSNVSFDCEVNTSYGIRWMHQRARTTQQEIVYSGGKLNTAFARRYSVVVLDSSQSSKLVIHSTTLNDSGVFKCQEATPDYDSTLSFALVVVNESMDPSASSGCSSNDTICVSSCSSSDHTPYIVLVSLLSVITVASLIGRPCYRTVKTLRQTAEQASLDAATNSDDVIVSSGIRQHREQSSPGRDSRNAEGGRKSYLRLLMPKRELPPLPTHYTPMEGTRTLSGNSTKNYINVVVDEEHDGEQNDQNKRADVSSYLEPLEYGQNSAVNILC